MWRLTPGNGINEEFHTKKGVCARQAYGFRNVTNYSLRVKVLRNKLLPVCPVWTKRSLVDGKGFEPSTPAMRTRCSPN